MAVANVQVESIEGFDVVHRDGDQPAT
jgi:hypothetical protein